MRVSTIGLVRNAGDLQRGSSLEQIDRARLAAHFADRGEHDLATAPRGRVVEVHGEVREIRLVPGATPHVDAIVCDGTGEVVARFGGRARPDGLRPGSHVLLLGEIHDVDGAATMVEPVVEESPASLEAP